MATIEGVAVVWLPVSDIDRSIEFYGRLGLSASKQDGDWAELRSDSITIGLNASDGETPSSEGGAVIAFRVDDLDAATDDLKGQGVAFTGEPSDHPWGRIATFADPDGHDVQLYQPPSD